MSMNAGELADLIVEKKVRAEQRAYDNLKEKVIKATTQMLAEMSSHQEVALTSDDMLALTRVTENLHSLGYKYCLIETQDSSGEILEHRLRISVLHLT